jgi:hypothetical protein
VLQASASTTFFSSLFFKSDKVVSLSVASCFLVTSKGEVSNLLVVSVASAKFLVQIA